MGESLAGVDFLGRCYDIFDLDPLDMAGSGKLPTAIQLSRTRQENLDYDVPVGVNFAAPRRSSVLVTEGEVYNSNDFTREISKAMDMSLGFDGVGSFGASQSVRDVTSQTQSRKYVYKYVVSVVRNFIIALAEDGERFTPSAEFSRVVASLPTTAGPAYRKFIERFGTHYTSQISLGGMAFQSVRAETTTYRHSKETKESFDVRAELELGAFKPKSKFEEAQAEIRKADNETSLTRSSITIVGATGGATLPDEWYSKLERQPIPLPHGARLEPLAKLLTKEVFPDDAAIATKRSLLEEEVRRYSLERGGVIGEDLRYGDRVQLHVRQPRSSLVLRYNPKGVYLTPANQISKDPEATVVLRDPANPTATRQPIFTAGNPNQTSRVALWIEQAGAYLGMSEPSTQSVKYGVVTAEVKLSRDLNPRATWMTRAMRGGLERSATAPRAPVLSGDDLTICIWDEPSRQYFNLGQLAREGSRMALFATKGDPLLADPETDPMDVQKLLLMKGS